MTLFFFAFSTKSFTVLLPASSNKLFPMAILSSVFLNVNAIPPQMIRLLTLPSRLSMSWILSETFAPPRIARNGVAGFSRALAKYSSSFLTRKPEAFCGRSMPTMELCARWAVPKASSTLR